MNKKKITLIITILILTLIHEKGYAQNTDKPNVLFIICDDLNDYVEGFGGHPQTITPNIDKLEKTGVRFTNAHSNAPVCSPSRASMFTGIYPHKSNKFGFKKWYKNPVLKNSKSIMEYLNENGYNVLGTGKIFHHGMKTIWDEFGNRAFYGPHAFNGIKTTGHPSGPEPFRSIGALDGTFTRLSDVPDVPATKDYPGHKGWYNNLEQKDFRYVNENDRDLLPDEENAVWTANKIKELEQQNTDAPFFLAVGFIRPHTPLMAPDKYFDMFPLDSIILPVIKENDAEDCFYNDYFTQKTSRGLEAFAKFKASYPDNFEMGLKKYIQAYLACVAFADDQIGKVLKALESSKFKDNTIIILTSDHGYNHGEKDYLFKNSLWEESTRVPLIVCDPRSKTKNKSVDLPVSLIDIYPTIADYCKLSGKTTKNDNGMPIDGHSLKPLVNNPEKAKWDGPDVALTVITSKTDNGELLKHFSVRSKNWRYTLYANGEEELYDHTNDPYEWNNIAQNPKFRKEKRKLKKKLLHILIVR
jgi:arylsulfatase A-like enzyme